LARNDVKKLLRYGLAWPLQIAMIEIRGAGEMDDGTGVSSMIVSWWPTEEKKVE
jgi:hypothetical protein